MRLLPLIRRTAWAQRAALAVLGLLVLGTAFLVDAGPRTLAAGYDRAARETVGGAPAGSTDIVVSATLPVIDRAEARDRGRDLPGSAAGLADLERRWRGDLPPPLRGTIAAADHFAGTDFIGVSTGPPGGGATRLAVGLSATAGRHVRYVAGRPPGPPGAAGGRLRLEAAMPAGAARRMGIAVGDVVPIAPEPGLGVRITGLFAPADPADPYWPAHRRFADAEVRETTDGGLVISGTALLDPAGYQALCARTRLTVNVAWTFTPAAGRITADAAPRLSGAVHQAAETITNVAVGPRNAVLTTGLDRLLDGFAGRLRATRALLSLALSGLFAAALGALALTARLPVERMREALSTQAARGASRGQLAVLTAGAVAPVVLPAAGAGLLGSALIASGPAQGASFAAVAALVVTAIALPAVTAARGPARASRPGRRLVAEAVVVAVAVGATFLLRRRGLAPADGGGGVDPLLAAVPALLAVAAGLITVRAYPYPLRLAGRALARSRSAASFIGFARATERRAGGLLPLVVLLLAVAVIGFTSTVGAGLRRTQGLAAWESVGGDARVDAQLMDPEMLERVRRTPGVREVLPAEMVDGAHLLAGGRPVDEVMLVAIDLPAYRHLMAGTPVRVPVPRDTPGGSGGAVPALFSPAVAAGAAGGALGLATDSGLRLPLRAAGTIRRFPGQPDGVRLVVVPYGPVHRATGGQVPGSVFVRGDRLDADALRRAGTVTALGGGGVGAVATYRAEYDALTGGELGRLVRTGFGAAGLLVTGYGALAVVVLLLAAARERGTAVAYLRTLGMSRRQAHGLAVAEAVPALVAAAAAGWALGLALPAIVGPAMDLRPYTGGLPLAGRLGDVSSALPVAGGLAVAAGLAVVVDAVAGARRRPAGVLRMGGT